MKSALDKQMARLFEKHGEQEILDSLERAKPVFNDYQQLTAKEREKHFRDTCKKLGLTVQEASNGYPALNVKEFIELNKKKMSTDHPQPYFMFWLERESKSRDPGCNAAIEFGHWHSNKKWNKQYPHTEYCYGDKQAHEELMAKYVNEMGV
jgi:hypothetical protein